MSLNTAALEVLVAKGLSAADILDVSRALDIKTDPTAAERKRRQRAREAEGRDMSQRDVTRDETPTPDKSPQTPKINPTPREHTHHAPARGAAGWKCPEGVDRDHWTDFLANRRTKRLGFTPTAYRGQLKQLDQLSDEDWPPGRIVQFAAERGWGAFFDPRGRDDGRRQQQQRNGQGGSASGFGRTIDALGDFAREIDGGQWQ